MMVVVEIEGLKKISDLCHHDRHFLTLSAACYIVTKPQRISTASPTMEQTDTIRRIFVYSFIFCFYLLLCLKFV